MPFTRTFILLVCKNCIQIQVIRPKYLYGWVSLCLSLLYGGVSDPIYKRTAKLSHDDVIKWKHFPRYWPFVLGIPRSPVNSPHKGQWRGALMFSLICVWINGWVNNRYASDLRRHGGHYDVIVMKTHSSKNMLHNNEKNPFSYLRKSSEHEEYRSHMSWLTNTDGAIECLYLLLSHSLISC